MSLTYGFALTGALLFALVFAPVLWSVLGEGAGWRARPPRVVNWLSPWYGRVLPAILYRRRPVLGAAGGALALALLLVKLMGGEFMPKLEEGNLWVRATLPVDIAFEASSRLAEEARGILAGFPVVTHVVSQLGRPDDGTDVTTFNNIEFFVQLKPEGEWPRGLTKQKLIQQMDAQLSRFPGVSFAYSQNIQDNVEEAMSGVKGENSLKLSGEDIDVLAQKAAQIRDIMARVRGIEDLAVLQETGQPELLVSIDRRASAPYRLPPPALDLPLQPPAARQPAPHLLHANP